MKVVKWVAENWFLVVALAAGLGVAICAVRRFWGMPTEKQVAKVIEWLIWACIEAERELQSGTGQLKLREVWNKFCAVPVFASVAKFVSFEVFSEWVRIALTKAKEMLVKNESLAQYVYGINALSEIDKLKKQLTV